MIRKTERFFQTPQTRAATRSCTRPCEGAGRGPAQKNLSVYDIQHELASAGHTISINALCRAHREEGFRRLPRRRDDEPDRPTAYDRKPHQSPTSKRSICRAGSFRTDSGGLFLFVPLMERIDPRVCSGRLICPTSRMVPAEQAVPGRFSG